MKKQCFLLALSVVIMMMTTKQQAIAQTGFSGKAGGGIQTSWLFNSDDNDLDGYSNKLYLHPSFALGVGYNFTQKLGVGLDVLYSFQGKKYELASIEQRIALDYLKIPLYFHFNSNPDSKWLFTLDLGPQLGILTRARILDKDGNSINDDVKDSFSDINFGAFISPGVEYKLISNLNIFGQLRYDFDFTNAEDDSAIGYINGRASSHNSTLGVNIGIRYVFN